MAKSKSFFGLRRGSTKSHTYQVYRGDQITKDRVYDVANPQSSAQMLQRLTLPLVANMASQLKQIVNHSFEGVKYGEDSVRVFRQINMRSGALSIATYVPKGMMNAGVADFTISRGTLPNAGQFGNGILTEGDAGKKTMYIEAAMDEDAINTAADGNAVTYAELTQVSGILQENNYDQLTFVIAYGGNDYQWKDAAGEDKLEPYNRYVVSRLVFDEDRFAENKDWKWKVDGTNYILHNGYVALNFGNVKETIAAGAKVGVSLDSENYDGKTVLMACVITSDLQGDTWKRSTAVMQEVNPTAVSYDDVIYTYLSSKTSAKSQKYLNSGSESVDIAGGDTAN